MDITTLTFILAILAILTYGINFIRGILKVKKSVDEPNIKQDTEIALLKKDIKGINKDLHDIRINHLKHLEEDVKVLTIGQAEIKTLLKK